MQRVLKTRQIYTDVQSLRDEGMSAWEIWNQELGTDSCILSGCNVETVLYYIDKGMPVLGMTGTGEAVLIVGYDAQNVVLEPEIWEEKTPLQCLQQLEICILPVFLKKILIKLRLLS